MTGLVAIGTMTSGAGGRYATTQTKHYEDSALFTKPPRQAHYDDAESGRQLPYNVPFLFFGKTAIHWIMLMNVICGHPI
ncbi:MAG: hypothetical protein ACJAU6_003527 [Alphaproteobacteria bacterium]|jgi:hypothetical protein